MVLMCQLLTKVDIWYCMLPVGIKMETLVQSKTKKVKRRRKWEQTRKTEEKNADSKDRITCAVCGLTFCDRSKLSRHMKLHQGEPNYNCGECGKFFYRKDHLLDHFRSHSGQRPFSCDVCDKSFARKMVLRNHMITHMKDRPFVCGICAKTFSQRPNLKRHMLIHTGKVSHYAGITILCLNFWSGFFRLWI